MQQIQQSTGCNGNQVDIGKELAPFQLCRALQAGTGMGPEQHQLYNDKGAGVDNIFLPQQGPVSYTHLDVYKRQGYNDLKDPSVSGFFRFLARVGDNGMKMQIVKIGFGDRQ